MTWHPSSSTPLPDPPTILRLPNSKLTVSHLISILHPSLISSPTLLHHITPLPTQRAKPIYALSPAAAALLAPVAVRRLQAGELIRLAVGLALSAPVPFAEAAVPAAGALLEGVGGRCGLIGGWGGEGAGRGGGGEEDDVELHFEVLVVGGSWKGGSEIVVGWKVGKLLVVACWMRRLMLLMPPLLRGKRPYLYSSLSIYPPAQLKFSTQGKYLKLHILPREAVRYARLTVSRCLTLLSPGTLSLPSCAAEHNMPQRMELFHTTHQQPRNCLWILTVFLLPQENVYQRSLADYPTFSPVRLTEQMPVPIAGHLPSARNRSARAQPHRPYLKLQWEA
ncbi:hypothetical protein V492_03890 [Pseudogymnoascus sp. VKM F-4246]|nr:hypothetical protein V492_03890 [Pseudogymnoascus sp. VKM F-4246]